VQYLAGLDEYEIDVHPAPFLDDVYLKELYDGRRPSLGRVFAFYSERLHYLVKAKEFDVVWIEKEVLPWVPGWVERTVVGSLPSVVDFDDAWHLRYSRSPNPLVRWTLGKKLERMARRANFGRQQVLAELGGRRRRHVGDMHSDRGGLAALSADDAACA
jgi:hypothetical protein